MMGDQTDVVRFETKAERDRRIALGAEEMGMMQAVPVVGLLNYGTLSVLVDAFLFDRLLVEDLACTPSKTS